MQHRKILEYLEELAIKLDIEIVCEKLEGEDVPVGGGLCKVKGVYKIFIDQFESMEGKIKILARALSSFDTEKVYLLPFIREILDKAKSLE